MSHHKLLVDHGGALAGEESLGQLLFSQQFLPLSPLFEFSEKEHLECERHLWLQVAYFDSEHILLEV